MTLEVTHRTVYRYEQAVTASYGQLHLLPRDLPGQTVRSAELRIDPPPDDYREWFDFFGNRTAHFELLRDHDRLEVATTSVVDTTDRNTTVADLDRAAAVDHSWQQMRRRLRTDPSPETARARGYVLDSPRVAASPRLHAYGRSSFGDDRPLLQAARELCSRVHAEFTFQPGATSVHSTVDEVLEGGEGVCQDFAHLTIGVLRSLGLAARYVSGYLETDPPPGQARLQGADASHAWVSLFVPGWGWIDLDPTNDQPADDRYVAVAHGRDYADVAPLKGVIFTEGQTEQLTVEVDVIRREPAT